MEQSDLLIYSPVCPHLGMQDDPRTSFRFPTLSNIAVSASRLQLQPGTPVCLLF